MFQIDPKLLDTLAEQEVQSLLECLSDPELRHDPRILEKVRKFLKDNDLLVSPKCNGVADIKKQIERQHMPIFDDFKDGIDIDRHK